VTNIINQRKGKKRSYMNFVPGWIRTAIDLSTMSTSTDWIWEITWPIQLFIMLSKYNNSSYCI